MPPEAGVETIASLPAAASLDRMTALYLPYASSGRKFEPPLLIGEPPLAQVLQHGRGRSLDQIRLACEAKVRRLQSRHDARAIPGPRIRALGTTPEAALHPDAEDRGSECREACRKHDEDRAVLTDFRLSFRSKLQCSASLAYSGIIA